MRFRYIGGLEFDGTEMPAAVTMFTIKFIEGQAIEVTDAHAIRKLSGSKFFEQVGDDEPVSEPEPVAKKTWSRRKKVVEESDPSEIQDAAE